MTDVQAVSLGTVIGDEQLRALDWAAKQDQPAQDIDDLRVVVHTAHRFQRIEGIGGSFSEMGGAALQSLPEDEQAALLEALFGKSGAGLSYCRTPIGASDFAHDAYSYCDEPDDVGMARFSVARDERDLIPFIKAAQGVNPKLRLHASPWSPPGWMKTTGTMDGGGALLDRPEILDAYAQYLRRYVEAYRHEYGIQIHRLMPQNEPDSVTADPKPGMFPGCAMPPQLMVRFVVDYLARAFADFELDTEIWGGTYRTITGLQSHRCMGSEAFRGVVRGCGFQYCFARYLQQFHRLYPGHGLMHTESVCHDGSNTHAQAAALFRDFVSYIDAGCSVYTYWNMILDETQTSAWGWRQNSLVVVDRNTGKVTPNPDLEVMTLIGRHVPPRSVVVESFSMLGDSVAFVRPDGSKAVLILNRAGGREATVECDGVAQKVDLPEASVVAITLD